MRGVGGRADPTTPIQPERTHLELQHVQVRGGVESRATLMSPRWEARRRYLEGVEEEGGVSRNLDEPKMVGWR